LRLLRHHPVFGQFGTRYQRARHIAALPSCVIQAPAFPAATNFCNSTIENSLRNARKSVYHLPSSHRHLYSVQLTVFVNKQEVHSKLLNVKTHTYIDPLLMALREFLPILKPRRDAPRKWGYHRSRLPTLCLLLYSPPAYAARHQLTQIPVVTTARRDGWRTIREVLCRVKRHSSRKVRR
jgi:hypothetical protein